MPGIPPLCDFWTCSRHSNHCVNIQVWARGLLAHALQVHAKHHAHLRLHIPPSNADRLRILPVGLWRAQRRPWYPLVGRRLFFNEGSHLVPVLGNWTLWHALWANLLRCKFPDQLYQAGELASHLATSKNEQQEQQERNRSWQTGRHAVFRQRAERVECDWGRAYRRFGQFCACTAKTGWANSSIKKHQSWSR